MGNKLILEILLATFFMKWRISLISVMEMTKFDLTSRETAVKNAKQYKINMARVRLIES